MADQIPPNKYEIKDADCFNCLRSTPVYKVHGGRFPETLTGSFSKEVADELASRLSNPALKYEGRRAMINTAGGVAGRKMFPTTEDFNKSAKYAFKSADKHKAVEDEKKEKERKREQQKQEEKQQAQQAQLQLRREDLNRGHRREVRRLLSASGREGVEEYLRARGLARQDEQRSSGLEE